MKGPNSNRLGYAVASSLVGLAARLLPQARRADWREEWRGELWHAFSRGRSTAGTVLRSLGCLPDAWAIHRRRRFRVRQSRTHISRRGHMLEDIRFAVRLLVKSPGFTAAAVLTLALGIGVNTAIFSVVHHVLLAPLPYPGSERMVALGTYMENQGIGPMMVSGGMLAELREHSSLLEAVTGYDYAEMDLTGVAEPRSLNGKSIFPEFLSLVPIEPHLGRVFEEGDFRAEAEPSVMIGYALWQGQLGGRRDAIGKQLELNGDAYSIIGVLPRGFRLPGAEADFLLPKRTSSVRLRESRGFYWVFGRLKEGATLEQLAQEVDRYQQARIDAGQDGPNFRVHVADLHERLLGSTRRPLMMLWGAVGVVFLIACANVANLLLSRLVRRKREAAVRAALGAGRGRLIRQFLAESAVLSAVGCAAALLLAFGSIALLKKLEPSLPRLDEVRLSLPVLLFTLGLAMATTFLAGLIPALRTSEGGVALASCSRQGTLQVRQGRLQPAINAAQVALAVILLIGAGLLLHSFVRLVSVAPGFEVRSAMAFGVGIPHYRYPEPRRQMALIEGIQERVSGLPGVRSATLADLLPLAGGWSRIGIKEDLTPEHLGALVASVQSVMPGYFRTLGIALKGHDFSEQDRTGSERVVIVDSKFADLFWPGQDPLGQSMRTKRDGTLFRVVGVAESVRFYGLAQDMEPTLYFPLLQDGGPISFVRMAVAGDAGLTAEDVRSAIQQVAPDVPIQSLGTMRSIVQATLSRPRFNLILVGFFAATALILAAVGIFGVLAHSVSLRTAEIGVRMALGADTRRILAGVMRQGFLPAAAGLLLGLAASFALSGLLAGQLFGISPSDPLTFLAIPGILALVAAFACYLPGRRAARVDPVRALRAE